MYAKKPVSMDKSSSKDYVEKPVKAGGKAKSPKVMPAGFQKKAADHGQNLLSSQNPKHEAGGFVSPKTY